jgi:predicted Zn-dependent protease
MTKCVITFNSAKSWNVGMGNPSAGQNDLFSVALHEFGHCVGVADVDTPNVVMSKSLPAGQTLRDLQPDDIAGRDAIYGAQ